MSLKFKKDQPYVMPVFFGPTSMQNAPGKHMADPYWEGGGTKNHYAPGDNYCVSIHYETDREILESMIPDCYTLNAPIISVTTTEFTNLGWLAGNTYNLINITCPVHFKGERDDLDGDLVLVMYENHADPILGGRETMGYSKIFCDIPRIAHNWNDEGKDLYTATASEWGFQFMKLQINTKEEAPAKEEILPWMAKSAGKMHYRYFCDVNEKEEIGKIPNFTKVGMAYPTILPKWQRPADYPYELMKPEMTWCNGTIEFYEPTWEQMPTWYNVAKGLHDLPVKRVLAAQRIHYTEPCEYCTCYKLR